MYESDGSPLQSSHNRQIRVHVTKNKISGTTSTEPEKVLIIPDDSIIRYSIPTSNEDQLISVRVC